MFLKNEYYHIFKWRVLISTLKPLTIVETLLGGTIDGGDEPLTRFQRVGKKVRRHQRFAIGVKEYWT